MKTYVIMMDGTPLHVVTGTESATKRKRDQIEKIRNPSLWIAEVPHTIESSATLCDEPDVFEETKETHAGEPV